MKLNEKQREEVSLIMKQIPNVKGKDLETEIEDYVRARDALTELMMNKRIIHHQMDPNFGGEDPLIQMAGELKHEIFMDIHEKIEFHRKMYLIEKEMEIEELERQLKEIKECFPVKTGKQVAKDNIRKQIVLINLFDQDEVLIEQYERLFGIDLENMTEEEINNIDLSTLAG